MCSPEQTAIPLTPARRLLGESPSQKLMPIQARPSEDWQLAPRRPAAVQRRPTRRKRRLSGQHQKPTAPTLPLMAAPISALVAAEVDEEAAPYLRSAAWACARGAAATFVSAASAAVGVLSGATSGHFERYGSGSGGSGGGCWRRRAAGPAEGECWSCRRCGRLRYSRKESPRSSCGGSCVPSPRQERLTRAQLQREAPFAGATPKFNETDPAFAAGAGTVAPSPQALRGRWRKLNTGDGARGLGDGCNRSPGRRREPAWRLKVPAHRPARPEAQAARAVGYRAPLAQTAGWQAWLSMQTQRTPAAKYLCAAARAIQPGLLQHCSDFPPCCATTPSKSTARRLGADTVDWCWCSNSAWSRSVAWRACSRPVPCSETSASFRAPSNSVIWISSLCISSGRSGIMHMCLTTSGSGSFAHLGHRGFEHG